MGEARRRRHVEGFAGPRPVEAQSGLMLLLRASDGSLARVEAGDAVLTLGPHYVTGQPYLVDWYVRGEVPSARVDLRASQLLRAVRRQGHLVRCEDHVARRLALAPVRVYGPHVAGALFAIFVAVGWALAFGAGGCVR